MLIDGYSYNDGIDPNFEDDLIAEIVSLLRGMIPASRFSFEAVADGAIQTNQLRVRLKIYNRSFFILFLLCVSSVPFPPAPAANKYNL